MGGCCLILPGVLCDSVVVDWMGVWCFLLPLALFEYAWQAVPCNQCARHLHSQLCLQYLLQLLQRVCIQLRVHVRGALQHEACAATAATSLSGSNHPKKPCKLFGKPLYHIASSASGAG